MRIKPARQYPDDIDGVLQHYPCRARVVVLWRRDARTRDRWIYLARIWTSESDPDGSFLQMVQRRFGVGWYRAKIYGDWDRKRRREEYLEQVSFGIYGPPIRERTNPLAPRAGPDVKVGAAAGLEAHRLT